MIKNTDANNTATFNQQTPSEGDGKSAQEWETCGETGGAEESRAEADNAQARWPGVACH